jgi:hypothetical protein
MTPPFEELRAVIERSANAWMRRGVPVDREDLIQQGWIIALTTVERAERRGIPLVEMAPYVCRAVIISLGNSIAAWTSSVILDRGKHPMPDATRPSNLRPAHVDLRASDDPNPEEATAVIEWARFLTAELERQASRFKKADAKIIRSLLKAETPKAIAAAQGIPIAKVRQCRREFIEGLRNNRRFARRIGRESVSAAL